MLRSVGIVIGRTNVVGFWSKIWRRLFGQPFSKNNPLQRVGAAWRSASRPLSGLRRKLLPLSGLRRSWLRTLDRDTLETLRTGREKVRALHPAFSARRRQF